MPSSRLALFGVLSIVACRDADGNHEVRLRPAPIAPSPNAPEVITDVGPHPADDRVNPVRLAEAKAARNDARATPDQKAAQPDADWIPKEFASGMARWKDSGVYVDGKPVGFLTWGELPIGCKASWMRDKVSAEKRYGTNDPEWRWTRKRYYKFTDYLKAVGVDIAKVKELHVYSARPTLTLIVSGRELQSPAANDFWFSFGGNTSGKPLPHVPRGFGNDRTGDKISGVMVYIDKQPPTLEADGLYLDGVRQIGVPYYGEPIRGGIRVYLDDKLATIIKRQELDPKAATKSADGELHWKLAELLTRQGVDIKNVVELWAIRKEKRAEKFSRAELETLTFQAGTQAKGGIQLGDDEVLANVLALHTRALKPADMPIPEHPEE